MDEPVRVELGPKGDDVPDQGYEGGDPEGTATPQLLDGVPARPAA